MALEASGRLGSPQLAGVKVNPLGFGARVAGRSAGAPGAGILGEAITAGVSAAITMRAQKQAKGEAAKSKTPQFGRLAFLAVSASELALIALETHGGVRLRLGPVIESVPRSQVASVALGRGRPLMAVPLTVTFSDGTSWALEVARPLKRRAEELARVFAG